ncbi:lactosylceramide 4-alpha-galactosyltransferase-like [Penaeus indicus]|uniref:lactosylceramide 4-alpha-galactosyltransferase-like n=1 Tax=Penaeus indicus TaxID=29960 RepID=UPI00300C59A1
MFFIFANQNPTAKTWYVVTAPHVDDTDRLVTLLKQRYRNLYVVGADLNAMFTGTPLEILFKSGIWAHNTPWPANNLSNLLRNVLLWLWGGMTTDTDCICVRKVTHLHNAIAYDEKDKVANNAIMHFEARHRFILETMEYLKQNFQVAKWHVNGPGAASHIAKKVCGTKNLNKILYEKCDSLQLMPLRNMQLYTWTQWGNYFKKGIGSKFLGEHKDAYILHMYNKLSKKRPVEIGSETIYDSVASVVCPLTYEAAKRRACDEHLAREIDIVY